MTSAVHAGRERNNIIWRTGAKNEKIHMIRDGIRDVGEKKLAEEFFFRTAKNNRAAATTPCRRYNFCR